MRRFRFEGDIYDSLNCVPMAARRKLDRVGLKVGLEQWQSLSRAEHLAICYMPATSPDECEALREVILTVVKARNRSEPKELPAEARRTAEPPEQPPLLLVQRSKALGFVLSEQVWRGLDEDERYALMKLGNEKTASHNLSAALAEFIG
jgi:hypothetical protein